MIWLIIFSTILICITGIYTTSNLLDCRVYYHDNHSLRSTIDLLLKQKEDLIKDVSDLDEILKGQEASTWDEVVTRANKGDCDAIFIRNCITAVSTHPLFSKIPFQEIYDTLRKNPEHDSKICACQRRDAKTR